MSFATAASFWQFRVRSKPRGGSYARTFRQMELADCPSTSAVALQSSAKRTRTHSQYTSCNASSSLNPPKFPDSVATACGIASDRDARAYNGCLVRHAQDPLVWDGPLGAYRVVASELPARAAVAASPAVAVTKGDRL
jgi:hypothetical protein